MENIYSILGHNGVGKTTLINILTGLIPPTKGKFFCKGLIHLASNLWFIDHGKEGTKNSVAESIGFCAQYDYALTENTVYENLKFFAEIRGIHKDSMDEQILRVMERLKLTTSKDLIVSKLNGGSRRKLSVAIALLNDPKIIIMDEPTSGSEIILFIWTKIKGMDPMSRREVWQIIKDLKEDKRTVVFTTQFMDEAEELSDRIAVLSKGRFWC